MNKKFNFIKDIKEFHDLIEDTTENGRFYTTPEKNVYPSVTTVLSINAKEGIESWKKIVGEEEALHVLRRAGTRGTNIHNMAEKYLKGEDWKKGAMPVNLWSFKPIKKILDEHVDNIYYIEVPLYSDYLKVAGRVDLIAEFDGKLSIIDFKTSRKDKNSGMIKNYFMQESAYAVMYEERSSIPINQLVTIMTVDNEDAPRLFIEKRNDHIFDFIETRKRYNEQYKK